MAEAIKKKNNRSTLTGLLDIMSPPALDFLPQRITLGESFSSMIVITAYPGDVDDLWLSRYVHLPGVSMTMHCVPTQPFNLVNSIRLTMGEAEARMETGNSVTKQRAKKQFDDSELLFKKLEEEQQKVFNVVIIFNVIASNQELLDIRVRNLTQKLSGAGMRGRRPINNQEEAFLSSGPWGVNVDSKIYKMGWRNMPAETVAGSFPFVYAGLNDGQGFILGKDSSGGIVLIDLWMRSGSRTNSNFTILGKPGMGKTTTIKKMMKEEFGRGCKIILLDPEDEYASLAVGCGGAVIDIGDGTRGRINVLQVRGKVPVDDPDEENPLYSAEELAGGLVALHFNFLRTFFKMYLRESKEDRDFTKKHLAVLEMALIETYEKFGIGWDTDPSTIPNDKWPHMGDLYEVITSKRGEDRYKQYWEDLELLLFPAAEGADRFLWCGPTTLEATDEVVVLNLQKILDADESVKRAQFFNALSWAWGIIDEDWQQRIILGVDEAYLLADPETPQSLMFLRNCSKRMRKREGGLWVITHNMIDFMDESIRRYGQALLDNPSYKLFMGQGENEVEALSTLLHLSDKEKETIAGASRGQGLLLAGTKRISIKVEITDDDLAFIGSAGGR